WPPGVSAVAPRSNGRPCVLHRFVGKLAARCRHVVDTVALVRDPAISIVIPVFDEEGILHAAIVDLRERLAPHGLAVEIVLAENGSSDRTVEVARALAAKFPEVRWFSIAEPNYGAALRRGIEEARAPIVV